jgi:hypothetical protein
LKQDREESKSERKEKFLNHVSLQEEFNLSRQFHKRDETKILPHIRCGQLLLLFLRYFDIGDRIVGSA